jgi:hypothetical protein
VNDSLPSKNHVSGIDLDRFLNWGTPRSQLGDE